MTKLHDWALGQAWGSCYSSAALSSNDSKTLYVSQLSIQTKYVPSPKRNFNTLQALDQPFLEAYREPSAGVGGGFGGARRRRSGVASEGGPVAAAVSEGAAPDG